MKLINTWLIILLPLIFLSGNIYSKPVMLEIDAAQFRNDDKTVKWEMYYSFPDTVLTYQLKNGKYIGELYFSVKISSATKVEDEKEWVASYSSDTLIRHHKQNLLGQKSFLLSEGQYKAVVSVMDVNDTSTKAQTQFDIISKNFPMNRISISDIELAASIEKESESTASWNESFKKNSLYVVPNPSLEFIGEEPKINIYTEIYNSRSVSPAGFLVEYKIYDAAKRVVHYFPRKRNSDADGLVEFISFPAEILNSGVYFLQVKVSYPVVEPKDSSSSFKKFYILNPKMPVALAVPFMENMTFEQSEFATMTDEQVKKEFQQATCIATPDEIDLYDELSTTEAKQKFLFRFWQNRDNDSIPYLNEAREKFRKSIDYANTYFSYGSMREGWRTERGRVLLRYGPPTQRDYTAPNGENRPYETWFYGEIQGGITFNFVDSMGFGNFILVNSNAIGEARNDNWFNDYVYPLNFDANRTKIENQNK